MKKVTFFMSVYNNEQYLREAVDSILKQTFKDFNFLIIDDCSTDRSLEILKSYSDPRIKIIENKRNIGIAKSINKGLKQSQGKYLAHMNADDISLPERLKKQVAFMENNPEIDVCGTWLQNFGKNNQTVCTMPTKHDSVFAGMLFENTIHNSTVIIRRDSIFRLGQFRDEKYFFSEDYEYWVRLGMLGIKLANIGEVLLKYRIHETQAGNVHSNTIKTESDKINLMQLNKLGLKITEKEFAIYKMFSSWKPYNKEYIAQASIWIEKLIVANKNKKIYNEKTLPKIIAERWFQICNNSTFNGIWVWNVFRKNPVSKLSSLTLKKKIKFFIKSLLSLGRSIS